MIDEIKLYRAATGEMVKPEAGKCVLWPDGTFTIYCPDCGRGAGLGDHKVHIGEEDKLTMEPSLVCPAQPCLAHYYVKNGQIQRL